MARKSLKDLSESAFGQNFTSAPNILTASSATNFDVVTLNPGRYRVTCRGNSDGVEIRQSTGYLSATGVSGSYLAANAIDAITVIADQNDTILAKLPEGQSSTMTIYLTLQLP